MANRPSRGRRCFDKGLGNALLLVYILLKYMWGRINFEIR